LLGSGHGGRGGAAGAVVVGATGKRATFKYERLAGDVGVTAKIPPWYGGDLGRRTYGWGAGRTGGPAGGRRACVRREWRGGACPVDFKMLWCARVLGRRAASVGARPGRRGGAARGPDAEAAQRASAARAAPAGSKHFTVPLFERVKLQNFEYKCTK
jgi:hypothetical protein